MKHLEFELQVRVCEYLNTHFPDTLFLSDTVASLKLTMGQAMRNKKIQKDSFKTPDLIIFEPKGCYNGLFIELKIDSPFKKDGTLKKSEHLDGQWKSILDLRRKGYYANFATGFDEAKNIIDWYMSLK